MILDSRIVLLSSLDVYACACVFVISDHVSEECIVHKRMCACVYIIISTHK